VGTSAGIVDFPSMVLEGYQVVAPKEWVVPTCDVPACWAGWCGDTPSSDCSGATPPGNRHRARSDLFVL